MQAADRAPIGQPLDAHAIDGKQRRAGLLVDGREGEAAINELQQSLAVPLEGGVKRRGGVGSGADRCLATCATSARPARRTDRAVAGRTCGPRHAQPLPAGAVRCWNARPGRRCRARVCRPGWPAQPATCVIGRAGTIVPGRRAEHRNLDEGPTFAARGSAILDSRAGRCEAPARRRPAWLRTDWHDFQRLTGQWIASSGRPPALVIYVYAGYPLFLLSCARARRRPPHAVAAEHYRRSR